MPTWNLDTIHGHGSAAVVQSHARQPIVPNPGMLHSHHGTVDDRNADVGILHREPFEDHIFGIPKRHNRLLLRTPAIALCILDANQGEAIRGNGYLWTSREEAWFRALVRSP